MVETVFVTPGAFLTLHYRLTLASDRVDLPVLDTFDDHPATLQLGAGQLPSSLEARLVGLKAGDHASFDLAPGEAYGPRKDELVQRISRLRFDAENGDGLAYQPGDFLEFSLPAHHDRPKGARFAGVLKELNDQYALFDFNHPLAGQALRLEVEIIGIL